MLQLASCVQYSSRAKMELEIGLILLKLKVEFIFSSGLYIGKYPSPEPMSSWGKKMKWGREKGEKCEKKRKRKVKERKGERKSRKSEIQE
jgi:hypothetical protein